MSHFMMSEDERISAAEAVLRLGNTECVTDPMLDHVSLRVRELMDKRSLAFNDEIIESHEKVENEVRNVATAHTLHDNMSKEHV